MNVGRLVGRLGPQHLLTLARHVAGGSEFLITANERLTRRQLFARIDALAAGLQALGARKGDRIATLLPACPEAVYALFVPWVLGSVEVSLDPRLGEAALRRILADCAVKIVLTTRSWRSRDPAATVAGLRPHLPGLRFVIATSPGRHEHGAAFSIEGLMTSEVAPWRARISLKEPGRIACVATPGRPLRAIEHARGAGWGLATAAARPHLDPAALRCLLLPFSPCHPAAPLGIMAALLAGGKVILMDHFEPQQALELIEREQVTQFCGTPGMYRRLLQAPAQTRCDLSSLRRATLAGGFCPPELVTAIGHRLCCPLERIYGTAESGLISWTAPGDPRRLIANTVGRPAPHVEVRLVDSRRRPLPADEPGEIAVRSPQMMLGYHNDPEATCDALDRDKWFYTGDLGALDTDGCLHLLGRLR